MFLFFIIVFWLVLLGLGGVILEKLEKLKKYLNKDFVDGLVGIFAIIYLFLSFLVALLVSEGIGTFCDEKLNINFMGYRESNQEVTESEIKAKIAAEQEAKVTERMTSKNINYKILNYYYAGNNLIINLRVENKSKEPFSIHKISGMLKDKNDNKYEGKLSLLQFLVNLNPGMYTDISLIFNVPTAQKYDLLINDSLWGDPIVLHLQ